MIPRFHRLVAYFGVVNLNRRIPCSSTFDRNASSYSTTSMEAAVPTICPVAGSGSRVQTPSGLPSSTQCFACKHHGVEAHVHFARVHAYGVNGNRLSCVYLVLGVNAKYVTSFIYLPGSFDALLSLRKDCLRHTEPCLTALALDRLVKYVRRQ
jgi:hypothetical protein